MAGLFFLGVSLLICGLYGIAASEHTWHFLASLAAVVVAVVILICSAPLRTYEKPESPQPVAIEYPASEYELQLRIVEFEGQRDTTYVLVKKINGLKTNGDKR